MEKDPKKIEVAERLRLIFYALGANANDVSVRLGVNASRLYNILNGLSRPNFETIQDLLSLYPSINLYYLFEGVGSPLISRSASSSALELPYFENVGSLIASESRPEYGKKIPVAVSGVDVTDCVVYEIQDNSMSPQLHKGQKVVMKAIGLEEWDWLPSGVYAVRYANYLVVRRVMENELRENGRLVLYADNEKSGAIHLKRADIIAIYSVVQVFGSVE